MNRTIRGTIGVVFVLLITFSVISIFQNLGRSIKIDITEQKLYTLSDGTKAILGKLNQPVTMKLYYARTAAMKGPDQIRFFNNYYRFVNSLLEEYETQASGMIDLQVVDPRPFSDDEEAAIRYGLKRFPITEEENFFFGLLVQTQFGVEKVIPFFAPNRQNFVEYDISYLIDTAITRQKKRIGVLSSLSVMGDDVGGYMAAMMQMQGQTPKPAWGIVNQLRQQYNVTKIEQDIDEIKDIDILLVIHPKDFSEKTLFAIDQFVLKGGRTIVFVDPHCISDTQNPMAMQQGQIRSQASDLNILMKNWGLQMQANTFAGDRTLAVEVSFRRNQRPETIINYLYLTGDCFADDSVITADLNQVSVILAGVLKETQMPEDAPRIERHVILKTTNRGNSFSVDSPFELLIPNLGSLIKKFTDGSEPVVMAYQVVGKFKSAYPDGIEVTTEEAPDKEPEAAKQKLTGLTEAREDCVVMVFSDVDMISDNLAYSQTFFGMMMAVGDNSSLLQNVIDDVSGSSDLISIRSRGNFRRPFKVVDDIEIEAKAETAAEEAKLNAKIGGFQQELQSILTSGKGKEELSSSIIAKKRELELEIHKARRQLRSVKMIRREKIESLGRKLGNINMLLTPGVILIVAIVLGYSRSLRKRHYISHASDS